MPRSVAVPQRTWDGVRVDQWRRPAAYARGRHGGEERVGLFVRGRCLNTWRAHAKGAASTKPTIVLVHGTWADGSSWQRVIPILQRDGHTVTDVIEEASQAINEETGAPFRSSSGRLVRPPGQFSASGDQACAPLRSVKGPGPVREHHQAVSKADQEHNVHEQPYQPRYKSG
jgi:hypothetical protein